MMVGLSLGIVSFSFHIPAGGHSHPLFLRLPAQIPSTVRAQLNNATQLERVPPDLEESLGLEPLTMPCSIARSIPSGGRACNDDLKTLNSVNPTIGIKS